MSSKKLTLTITPSNTKVQHLTDALVKAIGDGLYPPGSQLPSVNQLSKEFNLSRDTVFKAFRELKKKGIAESTPAKGYHVANPNYRILLFLDIYSPFKDVLYNSFITSLPKNYKVDLLFHYYNHRLFEQVMLDSIGRYNAYVIMNSSNEIFHEVLGKIDNNKLLLLDLGDFDKKGYSFVCQDFGPTVYQCLTNQKDLFTKYSGARQCGTEVMADRHGDEVHRRRRERDATENHPPAMTQRERHRHQLGFVPEFGDEDDGEAQQQGGEHALLPVRCGCRSEM
jgi:DNA-binding transcriptional regulator YhcF (GntR family)